MLLAVDLGNTHIVIGVFEGKGLCCEWRISTYPQKTSDEYAAIMSELFRGQGISLSMINKAILSSVVPHITGEIVNYIKLYLEIEPIIVDGNSDTGIEVAIDDPSEVGSDRIVNAVAAVEQFGAPLIVVDFGTATTFDVISADKRYLGGAIAPGINLSMDALVSKTAKLPRIEVKAPPSVIGTNTVTAMQSGLFYGYIGLVDGIIERMIGEIDGRAEVIATGGLATLISSSSRFISKVSPSLTLNGLRIIYDRRDRAT